MIGLRRGRTRRRRRRSRRGRMRMGGSKKWSWGRINNRRRWRGRTEDEMRWANGMEIGREFGRKWVSDRTEMEKEKKRWRPGRDEDVKQMSKANVLSARRKRKYVRGRSTARPVEDRMVSRIYLSAVDALSTFRWRKRPQDRRTPGSVKICRHLSPGFPCQNICHLRSTYSFAKIAGLLTPSWLVLLTITVNSETSLPSVKAWDWPSSKSEQSAQTNTSEPKQEFELRGKVHDFHRRK